jgi:hypothetical protein
MQPFRKYHELLGFVQRLWSKIQKERMTMKTLFGLVIASGFLLIAGCQSATVPARDSTIGTSESVAQITAASLGDIAQTPSPESDIENNDVLLPGKTTTPDANAQKSVQRAKESLAGELQISVEEIQVSAIAAVVWPDASLGCPQPDLVYAQVVTPGYIIVLEVAGKQYPFHTDESTIAILCPDGGLPEFLVTPGEIQDGQPWMPVP